MAYNGQCGDCSYYDFEGSNKKGYCGWYRGYFYPDESCSHQISKDKFQPSCYITTIVCDILGLEDNNPVLNNLREFRDNVLQKDIKYKHILEEYDVIGPQIARCIKEDYEYDHDDTIWKKIYKDYLVPTSNYIEEKKYDKAVRRYKTIVRALKNYYKIDNDSYEIKNYDYTNGGHGILKKK